MSLRPTADEAWLLETVVELATPLRYLLSPNLAELLNRPAHGLSERPLLDALVRLVDKGWIEFIRLGRHTARRPLRSLLETALRAKFAAGEPAYRLTPAGGAAWESVSLPEWERFLSPTWHLDTCQGEVRGVSAERVRQFLDVAATLGFAGRAGSQQWRALRPFRATYWKTLPAGCRVRVAFTGDGTGLATSAAFVRWFRPVP